MSAAIYQTVVDHICPEVGNLLTNPFKMKYVFRTMSRTIGGFAFNPVYTLS